MLAYLDSVDHALQQDQWKKTLYFLVSIYGTQNLPSGHGDGCRLILQKGCTLTYKPQRSLQQDQWKKTLVWLIGYSHFNIDQIDNLLQLQLVPELCIKLIK